ncbi:glycosyltransferase [Rariglobus hedericola]|uniref:Glycosyltransferase n=1 Tax=Rariglobus hedericola TaxID=2597822 RepID=A0A556QJ46_9BACT|nr:glycosyltransferase [Rariglobus hedericola]TSJ76649.1 glycosyltransferase [Rariglobus hedericola]
MKIWLLQDHLRSGGTERQTILLARAFNTAGHAVEVVTFRPGGTLAPTLAPIPHRCLQFFDTTLNWFAPGLLRAARSASPDVILCMGRMANCHAGRLARALPATTVVGTMRTGKPLPWLFRSSLHRVAHVVANSAESAGILTHTYGLPADRVSVIHNALVFPPATEIARDDALRAQHGAGPDTRVLLCVGMLRPEKNQRALVEIAAALGRDADWQLWIAGDGPARADCEALAAQLNVSDRVKFLGFQSNPTPLYAAADIAVLASQAESLSNFLIEAQAHGLPAVAYAAAGVTECMRPSVSGWVIPHGERTAFLNALHPLMTDVVLREQAGRAAREFARTAFDPERQAGAYLTLFNRLRSKV